MKLNAWHFWIASGAFITLAIYIQLGVVWALGIFGIWLMICAFIKCEFK
jgi:hypothetical protein